MLLGHLGPGWGEQLRALGLLPNHSSTWLLAPEPLGSSAGVALAFLPQGGKHLSVPLLTSSGHEGLSLS